MATFQAQVEAITQLSVGTTPTTAGLDQFLTDGAKEVIGILPPNLLIFCANEDTFESQAVGSEPEALVSGKILDVFAGNYEARKIHSKKKYKASLSTSVLYATESDPVFYIQNSKINVLPAGISCKYNEITYPTVVFGDESISSFPDEAEPLVVLYASMRTLVSYIGGLEIPPNVSDDSGTTETLTSDMDAIAGGQIGTDADFDDFDKWFAALGEMIEDDEDIELASAQIEKINSYIQAYNVAMQNELNNFNESAAPYQAQLQISIQNAQLADAADSKKLSKFQAEVAEYQAEVNLQVQEYAQNLQKDTLDYGWYAQQYAALKADYMTGIQMLVSGGLPQPQQQARR